MRMRDRHSGPGILISLLSYSLLVPILRPSHVAGHVYFHFVFLV